MLLYQILAFTIHEKYKKAKNKNGENIPHLEITEVVSIHCNIVNNDYH